VLYLTKPLGTGVLNTALKRGLITSAEMEPCIESMCRLNTVGVELGPLDYVHALTDITGFGLLGHLIGMCEASSVSADIYYDQVPLMPLARQLSAKFIYADNTMRNWKSYEAKVEGISGESLLTLCDPQTSGGLLIAVSPEGEEELIGLLKANKVMIASIGRMKSKGGKTINLK